MNNGSSKALSHDTESEAPLLPPVQAKLSTNLTSFVVAVSSFQIGKESKGDFCV